jgi:hypothetical protein
MCERHVDCGDDAADPPDAEFEILDKLSIPSKSSLEQSLDERPLQGCVERIMLAVATLSRRLLSARSYC